MWSSRTCPLVGKKLSLWSSLKTWDQLWKHNSFTIRDCLVSTVIKLQADIRTYQCIYTGDKTHQSSSIWWLTARWFTMATLILLWGHFFKNILLCDIFKNFRIPSFPSFPVIPQWLIPSFYHRFVSPWTIPITALLARIKQPHKSSRVSLEKWQSSQARDGLILKENKSKTHRFHTLTTSQRRVSHPSKQFYFFSLSFFQVKLPAMLTEIDEHKPGKSLNYNQLLEGIDVLWAFTMM